MISTGMSPLFITLFSLPDFRVYILKGYPKTEADALHFLKENDDFFTSPASRRESQAQPPFSGAADKPIFLSALDAVMQLTTRYEISIMGQRRALRQESRRGSYAVSNNTDSIMNVRGFIKDQTLHSEGVYVCMLMNIVIWGCIAKTTPIDDHIVCSCR